MIRTSQRTDLFYGVLLQTLLIEGDLRIEIVPLEDGYQLGVANVGGHEVKMNLDNNAIESSERNAAVMAVSEATFIKDRLKQHDLNTAKMEQEKENAAAIKLAEKNAAAPPAPKKPARKKPAAKKAGSKTGVAKKTVAKKTPARKKPVAKKAAVKAEEPAGKPALKRKVVKTADNVLA